MASNIAPPSFLQKVVIAIAVALGFFVLLPACLLHAWTIALYSSIKPIDKPNRKYVDQWRWEWLNEWYANSEDGVSGLQALVWVNGQLAWYSSTFPAWVPEWAIAYAWSAWRNNANNIKRPFRTDGNNTPWL